MLTRVLLAALLLIGLLLAGGYWYLSHALERATIDPAQIEAFFSQPAERSAHAAGDPQPCADRHPQRKAYFGALHIHTAASFDATAFGVTNTADDAYAFARGGTAELRLQSDAPDDKVPTVTLERPLDFAAVTDHINQAGEKRVCESPALPGYDSLLCDIYRGDLRLPFDDSLQPLVRLASQAIFGLDRSERVCGPGGDDCRLEAADAWLENQQAAERWHDNSGDCAFSTFHGYEYTLAKNASNLHRNVIFSNATVPPAVPSAKDLQEPEALWQWLDQRCTALEGCDVLTIPHNSNWSSGRMWYPYSLRDDLSDTQKRDYAALRHRMEPLLEIMQVKGDSECRNGLASVRGAPDEFCDFEKLRAPSEPVEDCGDEAGRGNMRLMGCLSRFSYARYALSNGLAEERKLGTNPFKLGIIAATDTHNGTPGSFFESDYTGATGTDRDAQNRLRGEVEVPGGIAKGSPVRYNPGGVAGLWAESNSRADLFSAMRRRETFGTSGPRIEPRFFGGWQLDSALCDSPNLLSTAYRQGVPMGADLPPPAGNGAKPRFLVAASRDAWSLPLQRIQIVKGWVDEDGHTHQAVHDVAGDPDNGASVNPLTCATSGRGFDQLCAVWEDPDFDPDTAAVYYSRVIENPSCRWSAHQCNQLPKDQRPAGCSDPSVPKVIQERAWTSPIWYAPL